MLKILLKTKKINWKRIVSILLILTLQFSSFPFAVFAQVASESAELATNSATLDGLPVLPEQITLNATSSADVLSASTSAIVKDLANSPESAASAQIKLPIKVYSLRKKNFRANEQVTIAVGNVKASEIKVKLFNSDGEEVAVEVQEISAQDPAVLRLIPPSQFKPGRYRLKIEDPDGKITTQDFTWGVLAINTNKSIYKPSETANIEMAVLDEIGMMVCDAKVRLEIKDPKELTTTLSTEDGGIIVNEECSIKDLVQKPDYETTYKVGEPGSYEMTLQAETKNGTYSIADSFEVRESVSFDVERSSWTRIFPPETYSMRFKITANEDFEGTVSEIVPESFDISPLSGAESIDGVRIVSQELATEEVAAASIFKIGMPFKGAHPLSLGFGAEHDDPSVSKKYLDFGVVGHDGLDFDAPTGTEILAVEDGEVVRAKENYDYGTTIVIQHEWGKSYYGHLSKLNVREGDKVKKGDVIALSGSTGLSSAPHLHFGIKLNAHDVSNGYYGKIDPSAYLGLEGSFSEEEDIKVLSARDVQTHDVKILHWNLKLSKGETATLGYRFLAPQISPQFYLLGPAIFEDKTGEVVFRETRQWQIAADAVTNNGRLYYGDGTNTVLRFQTHTSPFTFNGELSFTHGGSASLIAHTVAKAAPTRDEIIIGNLKVDGQLMVIKGINGYDVGTDYALAWTNAGTTGAQTCNSATEVDCTRAFDITHERLSGRAMVVYADTTAQKLYYCYWNGTAWGPQSACTPTNGTNDITLTSNGRPDFVSLKAKGGTNEILLGVSIDVGGVHEVETFIWDGSAWGTNNVATDVTNASVNTLESGQVFDVEWESNSGDALVVWGTTTAGATRYKLKPSAGAWGSEQTGPALVGGDGVINTMNLDADPASDRIAFASTDSLNDGNLGIWKANGTTAGWTMGNEDTTLANDNPGTQYADVIWQKSGSVAMWFAQTAVNSVVLEYQTATCNGTGCTFTALNETIPAAGADDATYVRLATSPNGNDIMALWSHIDRDVYAQHWNGSAWEAAASAALEVDSSPGTADNTIFNGMSAAFTYIPYSAWARNWKFWQGTDTTNTPTNQLAAENTVPTGFDGSAGKFRLRYSTIELSGMGQTDARKKLQYASNTGCTPNTVEGDTDCTWTDVDDPAGAGIWRYVDCNSGDVNICNDNIVLTGTTLSGTPTAGWWNQLKTGGTVTAMDHNALQLRELEFSVEGNGAAGSTTYYFRMYDVDQDKTVRREQDNDGANDCATATCTYPSLTTATASGPTNDQLMRHGQWFNASGVEQPFTF